MNETPRQTLTEQEARALGYHAGRMGLPRALNTLADGSPESVAWFEGWDKATNERANYANAMNKRDRERPQWEREHATGARDPAINYARERND